MWLQLSCININASFVFALFLRASVVLPLGDEVKPPPRVTKWYPAIAIQRRWNRAHLWDAGEGEVGHIYGRLGKVKMANDMGGWIIQQNLKHLNEVGEYTHKGLNLVLIDGIKYVQSSLCVKFLHCTFSLNVYQFCMPIIYAIQQRLLAFSYSIYLNCFKLIPSHRNKIKTWKSLMWFIAEFSSVNKVFKTKFWHFLWNYGRKVIIYLSEVERENGQREWALWHERLTLVEAYKRRYHVSPKRHLRRDSPCSTVPQRFFLDWTISEPFVSVVADEPNPLGSNTRFNANGNYWSYEALQGCQPSLSLFHKILRWIWEIVFITPINFVLPLIP